MTTRRESKNIAMFEAYPDYDIFDEIQPEKNLLIAILLSAMTDLKKDDKSRRKAMDYFLNNDGTYLFSFLSICEELDINPDKIRTIVQSYH